MHLPEPLPYWASLAKVLHGPTLALVLTYLEFHHPAPQDTSEPHSRASEQPVVLDCDSVCADLGVSRRTLHIAFSCLGTCWSTEEERGRVARAGREFINPAHSLAPQGHDPVKIYSFTGSKRYTSPARSLTLRRNHPKLTNVLAIAGLTQLPLAELQLTPEIDVYASSSTVNTLPQILKYVLPDWGDRRSERWDRWRRENGHKSGQIGRNVTSKDRREMLGLDSKAHIYDKDTDGE
jgi:hypothetical protein